MSRSSAMPLPAAVSGERRDLVGRAGRIGVYAAGPRQAAPLLLVHSINAAASAYEVRPVYERMAATRRVYAPDLPGFGFADRSSRDYTIRLYTDAVHDALDLIASEHGDAAVDVLAVSLASEFAARAATESPRRFRSLALVTPTGFARAESPHAGAAESSREIPGLLAAVSLPLWSGALFAALTSRTSIRYFLRRTYGSDEVDEGLVEYAYLTAHQPGARHAPLAFLSGRLFARDIRNVYEQLQLPVWVPHATRGDFRSFAGADWARARHNWRFQPMPTGALPHFEQTDAFMAAFETFLVEAGRIGKGARR